jgi:hypothetical protein
MRSDSADRAISFRISFISSASNQVVPPVSDVLSRLRSSPSWDEASICPADEQFPRAHVAWHEGHGFVIQGFEDDRSGGYFLAGGAEMSSPAVEINHGGQALERWPPELFVADPLAHHALDYFLNSGKQDPALRWVRTDGFPRETVWQGRAGREAWERGHPKTGSDGNQRP